MTPRSSATNGFSLVQNSPVKSSVGGGSQGRQAEETGRKRTDTRSKEAGGAGVDEERIDAGIDVGTARHWTRSGLFCSAHTQSYSSTRLGSQQLPAGQQGSRDSR